MNGAEIRVVLLRSGLKPARLFRRRFVDHDSDETIFRIALLNRGHGRQRHIDEDVMTHPEKQERKVMYRKMMFALAATATVAVASMVPTTASAWHHHHGFYGGWR